MKRSEHLLRQFINQQSRLPGARRLTRREMLRATAGLTIGGGLIAALGACGGESDSEAPATTSGGSAATSAATATTSTQASPAASGDATELPDFEGVPDELKGDGEVVVVSWGGALQEAQREAYFKPFEELTGIKVVESEGPDTAKIKAMVDTDTVQWDVVQYSRYNVMELEAEGDYWEEIDYSLLDTDNIDEIFRYKFMVDMLPFAQMMAYRTDAFDTPPTSYVDMWDIDKFPGPRTMPGGTGGGQPDLVAALLADGVSRDDVYPIDIDRAYDSLARIKEHVVRWWDAGAMPAQMLADEEAVMAIAWNGRIATIQEQGAPVEILWEGGTLDTNGWCVPKGAPNRENAMKFIAFTTSAIAQARLSLLIPYGFVHNKAADYIPEDVLKTLPTAPGIKEQLIPIDHRWWADNRGEVIDRWNEWILS